MPGPNIHEDPPIAARRPPWRAFAAAIGIATACGDSTAGETATDTTSTGTATTASAPTGGVPTTGGAVTTGGEPPPGSGAPEGRWVLRDRDGARVSALVEPRCGALDDAAAHARCLPLDFATTSSFPCVRVVDHEQRYINLEYELESAKLGPCHLGASNSTGLSADAWKDVAGTFFLDDKCEGQPHALVEGGEGYFQPEFTGTRQLDFALGEAWYAQEQGCVTEPSWRRSEESSCDGPVVFGRICPLALVPAWVRDLLPNPPYTMAIEYGESP